MIEARGTMRQKVGLWLGLVLAIGLQLLPLPERLIESTGSPEAARQAWIVLSMLALMATWWISEAIPIPVTSLLPLIIVPFFGVLSMKAAAAEYMHPVVVLLMGGFIIARAIEKWNLHARIALAVVAAVGSSPGLLVAGFMAAAALLSMWISNTATSLMMMPIALSVAAAILGRDRLEGNFTWALLLGIAYACSIGGLGTYVGTPTNLIVKGYIEANTDIRIGFLDWMKLGVPVVLVMVPAAWFVLTKWAFPVKARDVSAARDVIAKQRAALGPISTPEWRTMGLFAVVAGLWIFRGPLTELEINGVRPLAGLTDHMIAIIGVVLAFLIPSGSKEEKGSALLDWRTAESIPWGVMLLFGGGMSLAAAITATGLAEWMGAELSPLADLPVPVIIVIVTAFVIFLTEVTSNIATASALMPVLGALAFSSGIDVMLIGAPLAMAASCAFMLPMATGPNAVVFATGRVSMPNMVRAGIRLNLVAIVLISGLVWWLVPELYPSS